MSIPESVVNNRTNQILSLIPVIGSVSFVILYLTATFYYPGGSYFDIQTQRFSWMYNYWCDLMDDYSVNGLINTAQPVALTAMILLGMTLTVFWWHFPKYTILNKKSKLLLKISGTSAMASVLLLFAKVDHDTLTSIASFFGVIAMILTMLGLYKNNWTALFYFGLLNIILILANNYIYFHKEYIIYLPLIQKITFGTFLVWICLINFKMYLGNRRL